MLVQPRDNLALMASDHAGTPQIGEKMRELTLTFGRVMVSKPGGLVLMLFIHFKTFQLN